MESHEHVYNGLDPLRICARCDRSALVCPTCALCTVCAVNADSRHALGYRMRFERMHSRDIPTVRRIPDERIEVRTYVVGEGTITCLVCGFTSHNPNDVKHRYCGSCHVYHANPAAFGRPLLDRLVQAE